MTLAVVFPGQGSQQVGMLAELGARHEAVLATFDEARQLSKIDLWDLAQSGPAERLADTRITQPLMFVAGMAVWRALQAAGPVRPCVVAGHSLGEFSALVATGALSFEAGLELVQARAELMADAVDEGEGGMAAIIGLDDEGVIDACRSVAGDRIVEAVNFNAPGQVVISGHVDALERAMEAARERGARRAMAVPVSVPNHSALMRPAGESLATRIDAIDWRMPDVPLLQNAWAEAPTDKAQMLDRLKAHVYSPVRWTATIERMRDAYGVTRVIECGPGRVLAGLGKRIDRSLVHVPVEDPAGLSAAIDAAGEQS